MLRILGSLNPFHESFNRREVMRVGGLSAMSLGLPEMMGLQSLQAAGGSALPGFGRAKQIMLLYLQGAATQFETWDPKPEAPAEIRGEMNATATSVPGISICDHLPKLAQVMDRVAIVRSMTHAYNNHSNLYTMTGYPAINFPSETNPQDSRHHPFFGSVLDYLEDQRHPQDVPEVPRNIGVPFRFSTYSPVFRRSGPYGAFLGHGYDPVWTEFDGTPTKEVARASFFRRKDVMVKDPYLGITPESRLNIAKSAQLRPEMTLDRLDRRRSLLDQLEGEIRRFDENAAGKSLGRFREMAWSLMTSSKLRNAMDLDQEPMSLREKYGMTLFGQSALTGRRLLEAGCGLVSVFWDEYKIVNTAWDTHSRHFSRLGNELLPGFDSAVSSLLIDLEERGLLDETLVMCLSEHGRTPKVKKIKNGGGRDHWSNVYSVMLAGAGIKPGTVLGESDKNGAFVRSRPVSPADILATMYHLKGIDHEMTIPDRLKRPTKLVEDGEVLSELLA
ncbi:MAG: DUF1501 domain-containing protein [Planctomycetaceae bacterium]|nr:DUF1501 domain-containing protein [Planctomycetaceae bacterium]MBT6486486.1 DUF1501 domain-containing protein [Planctomycetaceae bacterium]MBT6495809.1 DUF1501 domain-containing protein [Planctomycetaceae bacterium]